jgi:hypothetical protein
VISISSSMNVESYFILSLFFYIKSSSTLFNSSFPTLQNLRSQPPSFNSYHSFPSPPFHSLFRSSPFPSSSPLPHPICPILILSPSPLHPFPHHPLSSSILLYPLLFPFPVLQWMNTSITYPSLSLPRPLPLPLPRPQPLPKNAPSLSLF